MVNVWAYIPVDIKGLPKMANESLCSISSPLITSVPNANCNGPINIIDTAVSVERNNPHLWLRTNQRLDGCELELPHLSSVYVTMMPGLQIEWRDRSVPLGMMSWWRRSGR